MKINKIIIYGFKNPERKFELEFSRENISVVYGNNGSGKSTLLRLVHAILSKDEKILLSEKVKNVVIYYTPTHSDEDKVIIYLEKNYFDNGEMDKERRYYNWDAYDQTELSGSTSILFGVNRGAPSRFSLEEHEVFRFIARNYNDMFTTSLMATDFARKFVSYFKDQSFSNRRKYAFDRKNLTFDNKNLLVDNIDIDTIQELIFRRYALAKKISSERVQKALFDTLSFAINPESRDSDDYNYYEDHNTFIEELYSNKDKLLEALMNAAENGLRNELIGILSNNDPENIIKYSSKNTLLSNLLIRMIKELKKEDAVLESISTLQEIFNSHLSDNKKIVINNDEVYINLGKDRHSLNELSSGERHLLTFLTMFLIVGTDKNFLMIDEPELSLNIKWQRELLPLLSKLAPNSQIIVASHSPSISKSNTSYLVRLK
ncbi:AAA family ATPase [Paenibacillus sp. MER 99-2]|uniref:AAA family ATPase n=1 Tax=Paenibacillus sp. MER 99-2 TaxID=2939572 RepID=UPI00203FF7AF|nr:AAA family ATPase [Paenibacillus sp. MER 99-2]MCM3170766.1 AAA family ATPase [Paenibacillus sp. MER 99-2]